MAEPATTRPTPQRITLTPVIESGCTKNRPRPPVAFCPFTKGPEAEKKVTVKRLAIILNPHSGNGRAAGILARVQPFFESNGLSVTVLRTERPLHATDIAREIDLRHFDCVAAIGGDGTLNEVLNGLLTREDGQHRPLAFIPGGTGNSFMSDLGGMDPMVAAQWIVDGRVRSVDAGKVTYGYGTDKQSTRYMLNMVGWGVPIDSNETAEKLRWMGPSRYDVSILWEIVKNKFRSCSITIDGVPIAENSPLKLCQIQNTQHAGAGMRLLPLSALDDGKLDCFFCDVNRSSAIDMFGEVKRGGSHIYLPFVQYYQFKSILLQPTNFSKINIDGENIGYTPVYVEAVPGAFELIVPALYPSESFPTLATGLPSENLK